MPDFSPTIEISLASLIGTTPGDPCPQQYCKGTIYEINISWTKEFFGSDAKCNLCGETWCLAEQVIGDDEA